MKWLIVALAFVTSAAADDKPTQFWNLTSATVTSLRLSHAGTGEYGDNVAAADADGVDHDERVKIADLPTGLYDMQLKFKSGRTCAVRSRAITTGKVFAVEDSDLVECTKKLTQRTRASPPLLGGRASTERARRRWPSGAEENFLN